MKRGTDSLSTRGAWSVPLLFSGVVLLAQFFQVPPLQDAATGAYPTEYSLSHGWASVLFAPFYALADLWTFNSVRQHKAWAVWLFVLYGLWRLPRFGFLSRVRGRNSWLREAGFLAGMIGCMAAWLAYVALFPRRPPQFVVQDPDLVVLDFHSHTERSHDGRPGLDVTRSARWHSRNGFHAAFITDHNSLTLGAPEKFSTPDPTLAFVGEELSLHRSHVVALGPRAAIETEGYPGEQGLRRFLRSAGPRHGALTVLSLPEYWKNGLNLEELARSGARGIEIANGSPKALDFPEGRKREVVTFCRAHDLFLAGATDHHGWGASAYAWNVMRLPGWRSLKPEQVQRAILRKLEKDGFKAVQVVVRTTLRPDDGLALALDPPLSLWLASRSLTWPQTLACLAWLWGGIWALRMRGPKS